MNKNYEDIKSIIVSTVSLLCKNGLSHHQLKIEGLLALTINSKDIVLINFAENFTHESVVDNTPTSSVIQRSVFTSKDSEPCIIETSSDSILSERRVTSDFKVLNNSIINEDKKNEIHLLNLSEDTVHHIVKPEKTGELVSNDNQCSETTGNISMQSNLNVHNSKFTGLRNKKIFKHQCSENTIDYLTTNLTTQPAIYHSSQFFESSCQKDIDNLFRKQYICEFPSCSKPYSTRRSMLRHQTVAHGRIPCFKKSKSYNQVMNELKSRTTL
ncbi:hypothetical protein HELRODRAFT_171758 [Helobdella robusta]|uniref:C2H2-type domain-containing protein n=1 Tax=Helobdella robusta TaxID=6412 RepID=T1F4L8_HELRO|nr:hypothetical protein HELRODRAFT_171758 [Helobdella robusta]ESO05366.1 hypothetical protein HELRODRAFT_171758 [Helobdella robusta]